MISRLSHVCLGTNNLEAAVDFYVEILGLRVVHEFRNDKNERYGAFISANGGTFIEIFNDPEPKKEGGLFRHICFEVEEIQALKSRLTGLGYDLSVTRGKTDNVLQTWINDPDGNVIEFHQHDAKSIYFTGAGEGHE